ncbi:65-kDa microtubule-associated protein 6 [Arabidopsis lyrata subsp. lyrata]|uniref:65-kDa microtubule-associated protein 6 n=1 Tax=Arabidopsis lyrata subsp. lyrata TaxID=81972 RepID=UPI000A29CD38|nr:65-kDa microtubule-associated protein 6 [Arabidopsis lyrata subsp. lyrata]|eukprot:XP_020880016.1 65-kDa microtubule-associated protein 6 [Arabidopsis lyrata subsp. lyrata]
MLEIGSPNALFFRTNTTCNNLLRELQKIWVEIGESETEKDRMLMELERECLQIYQRKVDEAANSKAKLHQSVAAIEAEVASLMAALGVLNINSPIKLDKGSKSLKEKLAAVTPLVEELRIQKEERLKQFSDIKAQIEKISGEISGYSDHLNKAMISSLTLEEQDLTLRKLNEYQTHLRTLQKEKSDRLNKVLGYVNEVHALCGVLGVDFSQTVCEVHPSLHRTDQEQSTNISDSTLEGLEHMIQKLKTERKARIQKLKDVVASLFELWNLMDTPQEERTKFGKVTYVVRSSEATITEPGILSTETIEQVSAEVESLSKLKASRMKELVMKRRSELEDLCRLTHIQPDTSTSAEKSTALIDSGLVDPSELLGNIEMQINKIKDEAQSRKDIMDRIDRWLSACEEENWLEEYNLDENRYSAGRGGHVNLKRAERARVTINKIPGMVDNLIKKTLVWENDMQNSFLYDGVRLVNILEDYKLTRKQQEEEKKRYRDQKKRQDLLLTQRESVYGSKPSPRRSSSFRKPNGFNISNGNGSVPPTPRRSSAGTTTPDILLTPRSYSGHHRQNGYFKEFRRLTSTPLNYVAMQKEDTVSTTYTSIYSSEPDSPLQG